MNVSGSVIEIQHDGNKHKTIVTNNNPLAQMLLINEGKWKTTPYSKMPTNKCRRDDGARKLTFGTTILTTNSYHNH